MMWELEDLASPADLAHHFGVTKASVSNWRARYATFPEPKVRVARGHSDLYSMVEVTAWRARCAPITMDEIQRLRIAE